MPVKYVCGKCGKELTEEEYEESGSIIVENGRDLSKILADDLCMDCEEVLVRIITNTIISPIPKE